MSRREWLVLLAIVGLALGLRAAHLGALSFAGDEETTTLAALALLEGWPPQLPGGLLYLRALPFTAMEALAVAIGGVDEFALRLAPALLSAPRVVAAWWFARPLLGAGGAIGVAALLAVSPFDVEMSRDARMYSLFGTLDLLLLALVVRLVRSGRGAVWAGATGALTVFVHPIGVLHAPVPLLAALAPELGRRRVLALLGVSLAMLAAFALELRVMEYADSGVPRLDPAAAAPAIGPVDEHLAHLRAAAASPAALGLAGSGALAALALSAIGAARLRRGAARGMAALAGGAWALASPVLGASGVLATLLLEGADPRARGGAARLLVAAGALATLGWGLAALWTHGSLESAARLLLGLPAPNWLELGLAAPAVLALAVLGLLCAVERAARESEPVGPWLVLIGAALAPVLLGGLVHRHEALRYHFHAWAPLLVLAWLAARGLASRFVPAPRRALAVACLATLVAVRPDQALRAVVRTHGPVAEPFAVLDVAPDHRGAGRFLRERVEPQHWIAAEDPFQQFLYAGRADVWLRRAADSGRFLGPAPDGGPPRDRYVGSRQVDDLAGLRALAAARGREVVWLVTSGEVEADPDYYRAPETHRALLAWRPLAWFVGADGLTHVYRLERGEPVPPASIGAATAPLAGPEAAW